MESVRRAPRTPSVPEKRLVDDFVQRRLSGVRDNRSSGLTLAILKSTVASERF